MKGQKFTPDSWAYREGSTPHFQSLVYSEETGENIAVVYHDENGHTAKLIASAPEAIRLLEAAREVILHFTEAPDFDSEMCDTYEEIANFLDGKPSPIRPIFENILNTL